jgi:nicotinamidase-related amidase
MSMPEEHRQVRCWAGRSYAFVPGRTALLVIDMQRDFLDAQGLCAQMGEPVGLLRAIVPVLQRVVAAARAAGVHLIHTREGYAPDLSDVHPVKAERSWVGRSGPLGRFLIRGERGHDFMPECLPGPGEAVVDKPGYSAFYRTDLEDRLRAAGRTHLVFTGVTTQCCVHSSLREAVDRGFHCLTLADGCAAYERRLHDASLALIQGESHLFGWIAEADAFIAALDGNPGPESSGQ